jgi:predicted aldo/keto reductase-like oxidoreductase
VEARRQGLIHYIGFSAHGEEPALALLDRFDFDSVLFPVNWGAWHAGFGPRIMQKAQAQGVGRLALKAMCRRALREGEEPPGPKFWYVPAESEAEAELALRFTLSMPVTAAIPPGQAELFDWALNAAERLRPLSRMDEQMLARQSEGAPALFPLSA